MIADIDIRQAYREDRRRPYYSIQSGRSRAANCRPPEKKVPARPCRADSRWIWGHFQTALRQAPNIV